MKMTRKNRISFVSIARMFLFLNILKYNQIMPFFILVYLLFLLCTRYFLFDFCQHSIGTKIIYNKTITAFCRISGVFYPSNLHHSNICMPRSFLTQTQAYMFAYFYQELEVPSLCSLLKSPVPHS